MRINVRTPLHVILPGKNNGGGAGWSNEAMRALILLWGEVNGQEKLDGVSRNHMIYKGIAEGMHKGDYDYSWKQCRMKVKNLMKSIVRYGFSV